MGSSVFLRGAIQMSCGDVLYQLVFLHDIWMIMILWKMEDPVGTCFQVLAKTHLVCHIRKRQTV